MSIESRLQVTCKPNQHGNIKSVVLFPGTEEEFHELVTQEGFPKALGIKIASGKMEVLFNQKLEVSND